MSQVWKEYQEQNKERFLNEMMDLLHSVCKRKRRT